MMIIKRFSHLPYYYIGVVAQLGEHCDLFLLEVGEFWMID